MYYRQCTLGRGAERQVSWIPEKFAKLNKVLKFLEGRGWDWQTHGCLIDREERLWSKGWFVLHVGEMRIAEEYLLKHERDYSIQREASDI